VTVVVVDGGCGGGGGGHRDGRDSRLHVNGVVVPDHLVNLPVHYPDSISVFLCEGPLTDVTHGHVIRRQQLILCHCVCC
jgi:hypothetical protein